MKKSLVLILLMLPFLASAQVKISDKCPQLDKVKELSFTDANKFADGLASKTLFKENFSLNNKYSVVYYSDDYERRKSVVRFEFVKVREGENRAAGMAGKGVYKLLTISGDWEHIHPVWDEIMKCCGTTPEGRELIEKTKRSTFTAENSAGVKYKFYLQKVALDWKIDVTEEK